MAAAAHDQGDTCAHLLRLGADPTLLAGGCSALEFAMGTGSDEAVGVLEGWGRNAIDDTVHVVRGGEGG